MRWVFANGVVSGRVLAGTRVCVMERGGQGDKVNGTDMRTNSPGCRLALATRGVHIACGHPGQTIVVTRD